MSVEENIQSKELQMGTKNLSWFCRPLHRTLCFTSTSCLLTIPLTHDVQRAPFLLMYMLHSAFNSWCVNLECSTALLQDSEDVAKGGSNWCWGSWTLCSQTHPVPPKCLCLSGGVWADRQRRRHMVLRWKSGDVRQWPPDPQQHVQRPQVCVGVFSLFTVSFWLQLNVF